MEVLKSILYEISEVTFIQNDNLKHLNKLFKEALNILICIAHLIYIYLLIGAPG